MSSDSVIEEDIFEEIEDESIEGDDIIKEISAKTIELDNNDKTKTTAENSRIKIEDSENTSKIDESIEENSEHLAVNSENKIENSEHIERTKENKCENIEQQSVGHSDQNHVSQDLEADIGIRTDAEEAPNFTTDIGDKISKAVINFSGLLAENVLQEALLINEIYAKDTINVKVQESEESDRDKDIRKQLFPGQNGRITDRDRAGYDGYLLDKLLRSKADPDEIAEVNGFDGKEEHFRTKDHTYPGLDSDDAYVKAELERANSDREFSDKNNNQMAPGLTDPFEETILQTIHEDSELIIEDTFRTKDIEPIQQVAGANNEHETDKHEEITEAIETNDKDKESRMKEEVEGNLVDKPSCDDENLEVVENLEGVENLEDVDDGPPREQRDSMKEVLFEDEDELIEVMYNDDGDLVEVKPDYIDDEEVEPVKDVPEDDYVVDDDDDDDVSGDEEQDCCEMTFKQKKAVIKAVRKGDIPLFEKLLEKKNADMGMTWYGENLLMVAVRSKREEICEFLIDNGIDWQYERKIVDVDKNGMVHVHKTSARQMAFDLGMDDLVELLDFKMNNLFPFVIPKPRAPRLRQPIAPFMAPALDEAIHEEFLIEPDEAKRLQKVVTEQYKQRQREIELENLEMMQRRRKGNTSGVVTGTVENESVHTVKTKPTCSDLNIIQDDISQVFGPDEGYETMSPVSPQRHFFHQVPNMKEHVSIRSTRAYHLKKAFIASKSDQFKRMDSPDYPMHQNNYIETVGSYNFESRKWRHPQSAPQFRNYSTESLSNQTVQTGLPFVHGGARKVISASSDRIQNKRVRSQSAHSNISPYSQVAKLLEQSRLFSPINNSINNSKPSTPYFPAISHKKSGSPQTKTRINYIYADRSSAKQRCSDITSLKSDLLPKRKLKC